MNLSKPAALFMITAAICCASCGSNSQTAKPASAATSQAAVPTINAESEKLFQEGLRSYEAFDYEKAIAAYNKAIAADGNNYKAWSGKGIAMAMRGNSTGSQKDVADGTAFIQKALTMNPNYVPTFYDLALAYKIGHHYEDSITWFKKVIEKEPDNTWSYYGIATIYGDKGQAKEAVEYLKKAIALDPTNVREAARTQSHFDKIRNDAGFKKLISG